MVPGSAIQLGPDFPLQPVGCEKASSALFACLDKIVSPLQEEKSADASSANLSLSPCANLIAKYDSCVADALKKPKNSKLARVAERVPDEYRYSAQK